ncbi:MAG: Hpt domain-containing protein [Verrucomicrobiota bacterium]
MPEAEGLIDWEQLLEVTDNWSADFVDIYRDFLEEADRLLSRAEAVFPAGEWGEIGAIIHQLKGAAGSFGYRVLAARCADCEAAAKAGAGFPGEEFAILRDLLRQSGEAIAARGYRC